MKVAYIVLAHHQPSQLARLVRVLGEGSGNIIIHVDAKASIDQFRSACAGTRDVRWIDPRVRVNWYGFSTVVATRRLLKKALQLPDVGRICLLSGNDYPIKSVEQIETTLLNGHTEYMRVDRLLCGVDRDGHTDDVERYHFCDWPSFNPSAAVSRPRRYALCHRIERIVNDVLGRRRYPEGHVPYQGSQWWALTRECAQYVDRYIDEHPAFWKFHRYGRVPDEIVFHTVVKQSPFGGRVSHDIAQAGVSPYEAGCHYVDWITPGVRLPKVLDLGDWERLRSSRCLFARKFDQEVSAELLDRFDREVHGTPGR
jgi:hypothetical protein